MPLTDFQRALLAELAVPPTDERYLAGGAALHFAPNSTRFSDDLDFFHDSEARVASAYSADRSRLESGGFAVEVELSLPGFVRAVVSRGDAATRVDWYTGIDRPRAESDERSGRWAKTAFQSTSSALASWARRPAVRLAQVRANPWRNAPPR